MPSGRSEMLLLDNAKTKAEKRYEKVENTLEVRHPSGGNTNDFLKG